MSSKYYDVTSIMQVIGCVYNNPSLLDATDKYSINEEDFHDMFHRTVFGAIYKLYELGAEKVSLHNIADFFSSRPKSQGLYEAQHGPEWLTKASEAALPLSFDYYYSRMKKMTLLRAYDAAGLDVTDIYDPDNILDIKKKQAQEEYLDSASLLEIADSIDSKIEKIKIQYVDAVESEAKNAADGLDSLLERLAKYPDAGVPLYGPLINTVTRGARLKKLYLRSAASGYGKAIPNNTVIPTPNGYRKVGDIRPGDYLFGQDGKPTKVVQIHPQPTPKQVYEVEFSDGRIAECCEDHLWEYCFESHRGLNSRVESVKDILNRVKDLKNGFKRADGRSYRFRVKLNEPVEYPERQYSVSPYAMGALLGDGSFRYIETQKALSFSSADEELPNRIAKLLGNEIISCKNSEHNYNYTFKPVNNITHNLWVEEVLKDYPELWNVLSQDKFIPQDYLMGSVSQRMELLQGLLDTDGCIDVKGRIAFTTISPRLRDDIIELCHSLGMTTSYIVDSRTEKYTTGECYVVHIQAKKEIKPLMFQLERKRKIAEDYAATDKRSEHKEYNAIIDIRATDRWEEMTCFTVDNENHLFLMNDFIVTHNTRTMIADVCQIGCNMIYDESFGWIKNGTAQPVLYITTEQELEEVQTMMLAFLSAVNEEHILNHRYEEGEEERVAKAVEVLKNGKVFVVELPDFSLSDLENIIKLNIRENNIKYVVFDYIMSSLKILGEVAGRAGGVRIREDNILFMMSRRLKDLANQYGIFVLSGTQLSGDWRDADTPDQNLLRGAKSIADSIDLGVHILPASEKDLENLAPILSANTFEKPNVKLSVYKNRRGRYKGVYLWCKADLGICRVKPMFCTSWNYEIQSIEDIKIFTKDDEEGAF